MLFVQLYIHICRCKFSSIYLYIYTFTFLKRNLHQLYRCWARCLIKQKIIISDFAFKLLDLLNAAIT